MVWLAVIGPQRHNASKRFRLRSTAFIEICSNSSVRVVPTLQAQHWYELSGLLELVSTRNSTPPHCGQEAAIERIFTETQPCGAGALLRMAKKPLRCLGEVNRRGCRLVRRGGASSGCALRGVPSSYIGCLRTMPTLCVASQLGEAAASVKGMTFPGFCHGVASATRETPTLT